MPDVLIFGDTRSPALRREVQIALPDPVAYLEHDGKRYVFASSLEVPRLRAAVGDLEVISLEELGMDEFLAQGQAFPEALEAAVARGCERVGLREAVTPRDFPLEVAEFLQQRGFALRAEGQFFDDRRRSKSERQIEGVTRAQRAAEAAMAAVCDRIRAGDPVDAEELRGLARRVFAENSALPHDMLVVACGPQGARPHEEGTGPIEPHEPIVLDIFPRDFESGCWGDLTRTVCLGEPGERLRGYHADVREAQRRATEAVRPGIGGGELNRIAAQCLADRGHPTRLDRKPEEMPTEGFIHALGHGVGLEVHEEPWLDEGGKPLVAGDVVTIEPGVYYEDFGGVRIEDLVLVTEDGHEVITRCPYDLEL